MQQNERNYDFLNVSKFALDVSLSGETLALYGGDIESRIESVTFFFNNFMLKLWLRIVLAAGFSFKFALFGKNFFIGAVLELVSGSSSSSAPKLVINKTAFLDDFGEGDFELDLDLFFLFLFDLDLLLELLLDLDLLDDLVEFLSLLSSSSSSSSTFFSFSGFFTI